MRNSSHSITRITCARGGTSIPASFSTASQIRQVVHHAAEIVDAVGVGDVGVPGLPLAHLLGAAVVEADVRHRVHDLLAVELQDDAQHAVRAGMLRADVEEHEIRRRRGLRFMPHSSGRKRSASCSASCLSSGSWNGPISVARAG